MNHISVKSKSIKNMEQAFRWDILDLCDLWVGTCLTAASSGINAMSHRPICPGCPIMQFTADLPPTSAAPNRKAPPPSAVGFAWPPADRLPRHANPLIYRRDFLWILTTVSAKMFVPVQHGENGTMQQAAEPRNRHEVATFK